MKNISFVLILLSGLIGAIKVSAQTGISVSPPKTFFQLNPGEEEVKKLLITNPSPIHGLDLSVSVRDWHYDEFGSNVVKEAGSLETSCADWLSILPSSVFYLEPNESKEIEILLQVPAEVPAGSDIRTLMLYISQINPADAVDQTGANIKIAVRTGVKIYHRNRTPRKHHIEPVDFHLDKDNHQIVLIFENQGNVWTDGTIYSELLSQARGDQIQLNDIVFYTLPGDRRKVLIPLEEDLQPGTYIISSVFEYADIVNMAELKFELHADEK